MAYTAAQINSIFQAVLQRPADTAAIQTYANSSQSDAQVRTQIETSYEASVNVNPIIRLYQGAFGRLPDTSGLQANYTTYINGYNITQLAQNFLNSSEGVAKFGSSATVTAGFVSTLYTQALGRTAGSSEISYWTSTGKSAAQVLAEISNSQEAVNKEAAPIVTYLDSAAIGAPNSGSLYSQTSPTGGNGGTNTGTTVNFTGLNGETLQGSAGNDTFSGVSTGNNANDTIQTGDVVNGGTGTDTVNYNGSSGQIAIPVLNSVEIVNLVNKTGAIGTSQTVTADFSNTGVSLVTVQNATALGDFIGLKAGQVAGLDNVKYSAGGGATETFVFSGSSASVALANGTSITGGGVLDIRAANALTLNILSTGSAANTVNTLTNSGSNTVTTSLNISGDKGLSLGTSAAAITLTGLTTIDATANNAGVKLSAVENSLTSAKFGSGNDSFLTGSSFGTTTFGNVAAGAAGAVTNTANTAATATVDGGAGLNYIGANVGSLNNLLASGNKVTNFQVLEVQDALTTTNAGGGQTYDLSKIAGLGSIQFDSTITTDAAGLVNGAPATGGVVTFNNLTSGGSITFADNVTSTGGATNLVFGISGAAANASDTETVFLSKFAGLNANTTAGGTHNVGAFTLANVENLVLNNRDIAGTGTAGVTTFTGVADAQLTKITLQSTAVDDTGAATKAAALVLGTGFTSTVINTVDATGYGANVDAANLASKLVSTGATILGGGGELNAVGGTGIDTITVGVGGGAINGGTGVDTINLGSATTANITLTQPSLATGSGTIKVLDVVYNTGGDNATVGTADSVNGFHLGATATAADVLAFGGTAVGGAAPTFTANTGTVTSVAANVTSSGAGQTGGATVTITNGIATVSGATGTAAVTAVQNYLNTTTAGNTAAVIVGSDTYVVNNGAATGNVTDDAIVKLIGVSSETSLSNSAFGTNVLHIA